MSLKFKIALPLVAVVVLLGSLGHWFVRGQLQSLFQATIDSAVDNKVREVEQAIARASDEALGLASLFSRGAEVVAAFEVAQQGDIRAEQDPKAQEARVMLRHSLGATLAGYQQAMHDKLQLHFHLPSGRSLARMWRDKQTKKNGQWVDISDDISSFRPTVMEVNRTGTTLKGIELGSGGFEIRGLSPVMAPSGKQLGSVEVLVKFDPVLAGLSKGQHQNLLLYMNASGLSVTTALQDQSKFPLVGKDFVRVSSSTDGTETLVTPELLHQAQNGLARSQAGSRSLAAFPIRDYSGAQVGVLVYAIDTSAQLARIHRVETAFLGVLGMLLVLPLLTTWFITGRFVARPIGSIISKIKDITEDRADLKDRLDDRQRDEIGELAVWFNRLMTKIDDIFCQQTGLVNMLNAVPDPIFAVDADMRIITANTATSKFLGKPLEALRQGRCADHFKTKVCGTEHCPIHQAKKVDGLWNSEVIDIGTPDTPCWIQPVGDILRDCHGEKVGFVEVARVVTDLVIKEHEVQQNLSQARKVNTETQAAAGRIADASTRIGERLGEVNQGAGRQRDRAAETASAMEQMNATVAEVAQSAATAAQQADQSREQAQQGADVVAQAVAAIGQVRDLAEVMKRNMAQLGQRADGIGQVMNVISDIADQTNLLALNAAIEAARAGEAGRGFAVVADEVRKLAEKTMTATKEVGQAIEAIQQGTGESIRDMDASAQAVLQASQLANQSGEALAQIVALINRTTDQVRSIATAAEEQSATSEQINRAVEEVNAIAGETATGMDESVQALAELTDLAAHLRALSQE